MGTTNNTGKSAYDVWKELNPNGTKEQFIQFLKPNNNGLKLSDLISDDGIDTQTIFDNVMQKINNLEELVNFIETF